AAAHKLLGRFNPDNFAENSPLDATGDSSYCLDKGAVVAMCLRSRGARGGGRAPPAGALHDPETLTFVMVHELAHIAVDDYDHPPEFWRTFKFLLAEAQRAGCYRSPDFAAAPVDYCGVHVGYNPLYDSELAMI
ncbi:MAG: M48 family peptidase, partial [Nitrosomonadaceae bacterium]|nr:M48 family peptidase [Nitrosomonadaceae bacterium]